MAAATKLAMTSAVPAGRAALLTVEEVAELRKVPFSWVYERTRSRGVNRIPGFRLANTGAFRRRRYLTVAELCISDDICGTHNSIPPAGLYLDEVADQ
jgi:hypothetical protein